MGLTILAWASGLFLLALVPGRLRRAEGSAAGYLVSATLLVLGLFAFLEGSVAIAAWADGPSRAGLVVSRLASALMVLGSGLLACYALAFPRWLGAWAKPAALVLGLLCAALAAYIGLGRGFVIMVARTSSGVARITGKWYLLGSDLIAAVAALSALIHGLRALLTKDRINRQRSLVAFLGAALGVVFMWIVVRLVPERSGVRWSYALMPLAALLIGVVEAYSFSLRRLFDWRQNAQALLSFAILAVLFGLPAALAVQGLLVFARLSPLVPALGAPLVFLVAYRSAKSFAERRLERLGLRREYREELESALAHVDLAAGRDQVLAELEELMLSAFETAEFSVLIEDDRGALRVVRAPAGISASLERGAALQDHIERSGATVLMRSEAQADPRHEAFAGELLALFDALRAEALIFAREGRRVIGAFALGARRSGADYDDYAYDTLRAIYGKLFVFAYYLKNVARESIVYTVDRELALSDQIVRFALEKVDKVEHPAAEAAWATMSTRSLGGDFVDFVRMSKDRWFFVLGDVSGKGLSASMNMLILKSMIRTFLRVERDFAGLVQRVNAFIKDNLPKGSFFAGLFGYFDFSTGSLYFINCGVPALLLYSPSFDAFVEVQGEGKVLGFVRNVAPYLKPRKLALPPGSAIMAVTDGVLESENLRGERFGKERLLRGARERLGLPAQGMVDGVVQDLLTFTDRRQEDDITLLALKMLPRRNP